MNLQNLNVAELSAQEMQTVEGGSWIGDCWDAVCDFFNSVACSVSRYSC